MTGNLPESNFLGANVGLNFGLEVRASASACVTASMITAMSFEMILNVSESERADMRMAVTLPTVVSLPVIIGQIVGVGLS